MLVVFPMAGRGKRFIDAGYLKEAKPFLRLGGKPLIQWAIESYPKDARKVFALRGAWSWTKVKNNIPGITLDDMVSINHETRGPVETLLLEPKMVEWLSGDDEILIADCDAIISPDELNDALQIFRASDAIGGVTTRSSDDPACSFAKVEDGFVTETREKDPFTMVSTTGPYWFRRGHFFLDAARDAMKKNIFSISPCYNYLIYNGQKVKAVEVSSFKHLGTPELYKKAKEQYEKIGVAK